MSTLQGPVFCPAVQAKQTGAYTRPLIGPLMKAKALKSGFWGNKGINGARTNLSHQNRVQQCKKVQCSLSSSSNGNGSMAENFNENDEDYVNSSIVEAGTLIVIDPIICLNSMVLNVFFGIFGPVFGECICR